MTDLKLCRLCLQQIVNNNFCSLENKKHMLNSLMLNLNLMITKEPVVCNECATILHTCSDFKSRCIDKIDAKFSLCGDEKVCQLCLNQAELSLVDLHETKENMFIVEMLCKQIPEINLFSSGQIMSCEVCIDFLTTINSFILNCTNVEDKINKYIELEGINRNRYVELSYVQENKLITNNEIVNGNLKEETNENFCENLKTEFKPEDIEEGCLELTLRNEDINIKSERDNGNSGTADTATTTPQQQTEDQIQLGLKFYQCDFCEYRHKFKSRLKQHMLMHMSPSEIELLKCYLCPYVTKRKGNLRSHMLNHKNCSEIKIHKCDLCSYSTKRLEYLKKHSIIHKSYLEVKPYRCALCSYITRQKSNLTRHMLRHKNSADLIMHKCKECPFETKHRGSINRHVQKHKNSVERIVYKCEFCPYEAKTRDSQRRHMIIHKSTKEVTIYMCEVCAYKTRIKRELQRHLVKHRNA